MTDSLNPQSDISEDITSTSSSSSHINCTVHPDGTRSKKGLLVAEGSPHAASLATPLYDQKGPAYSAGITLATMVGGLSSVCIKQLLLPIQVSFLSPTNTNLSFTLVASTGALAGLIAAPLVGALSDRTTLRWGRRRPWIVFGLIATVVGMLWMAQANTIPSLLVGEIFAQIGVDTILTTVTALLPDQVSPSQRSFISALIGFAPNVGGILGLLLVTHLTNTRIVAQGYELMALVSVAFIVFFLVVLRERPVTREIVPPFQLGQFLMSFVHPLTSKNFVYVLVSRCLVYLSFTILGAYLLFYLRGVLHFTLPQAAAGVTTVQLVLTSFLLVCAVIVGVLSARITRLKPFVFFGAILMALGLFLMVFAPVWSALLLAASIFGAGFGIYLGVDIALAVRVLPDEVGRGKDLGIIYTAIFLPLIVSPILGGTILSLSHNNFALLFALAACSSGLAALSILPVKIALS